jgi:hypothetical protein
MNESGKLKGLVYKYADLSGSGTYVELGSLAEDSKKRCTSASSMVGSRGKSIKSNLEVGCRRRGRDSGVTTAPYTWALIMESNTE